MASENTSGTKTVSVIGTAEDLATITSAGTFVLHVDASNLASGEEVTLNIYTKVLSSSSEGMAYTSTFSYGTTSETPNLISWAIPSVHSVRFELDQLSGTARAFDWSVIEL